MNITGSISILIKNPPAHPLVQSVAGWPAPTLQSCPFQTKPGTEYSSTKLDNGISLVKQAHSYFSSSIISSTSKLFLVALGSSCIW